MSSCSKKERLRRERCNPYGLVTRPRPFNVPVLAPSDTPDVGLISCKDIIHLPPLNSIGECVFPSAYVVPDWWGDPTSKRISVVGRTGSGKTFLVRALLGESDDMEIPFDTCYYVTDKSGREEVVRTIRSNLLYRLRQRQLSSRVYETVSRDVTNPNFKMGVLNGEQFSRINLEAIQCNLPNGCFNHTLVVLDDAVHTRKEKWLLQAGRSHGISTVILGQGMGGSRGMDADARGQFDVYVFCGRETSRKEWFLRDMLCQFTGDFNSSERMAKTVKTLPDHSYYFVNVKTCFEQVYDFKKN